MMFSFFGHRNPRSITGSPTTWNQKVKWEEAMFIDAQSYSSSLYRPIKVAGPDLESHITQRSIDSGLVIVSPCGRWAYRERLLPKARELSTYYGSESGSVWFNDDIAIPMLHELDHYDKHNPWMSFTPMEFFTLRPGTRYAKGHTIVAGLGLGWQLTQVCAKKSVKSVTLIEKDASLVDWILPQLETHGKLAEVVVGDAEELAPKMTADVALIDIFKNYGDNELRKPCPNIDRVWCWGSARIGSDW